MMFVFLFFCPAESLPGCGGGEHRPADFPAFRGVFSRHVLAARAAGPAAGDAEGCRHPAGPDRCYGSRHVPGASTGPSYCSDTQQLREAAQQAETDGSGASDAAHRAAAALHLRVRRGAGAHCHHQGGAAAGAAGNPQLQVSRDRSLLGCFQTSASSLWSESVDEIVNFLLILRKK